MLTTNIDLKNFKIKTKSSKVRQKLNLIIKEKNQLINSLSKNYKYNFKKMIFNIVEGIKIKQLKLYKEFTYKNLVQRPCNHPLLL